MLLYVPSSSVPNLMYPVSPFFSFSFFFFQFLSPSIFHAVYWFGFQNGTPPPGREASQNELKLVRFEFMVDDSTTD